MSIQTQEQKYENALITSIYTDLIIVIGVYLIFPLIRTFFPHVYASQEYLSTERKNLKGKIFWYINVYTKPLCVYAQRGNMATIFIIYSTMMMVVYLILGLLSLTILFPLYFYGTDQARSTNYISFWSLGTISHLSYGAYTNFVPMGIMIIFGIIIMLFYQQFTIVFCRFRQRCLRRAVYANYVILLQNIPVVINEKRELEQMLSPIAHGIEDIIPIPKTSYKLSKLFNKFSSHKNKIYQLTLKNQQLRSQYYQTIGILKNYEEQLQISLKHKTIQNKISKQKKQQEKIDKLIMKNSAKEKDSLRKKKKVLSQIQAEIFKYQIDVSYLFKSFNTSSKVLPKCIERKFTYINQHSMQINNFINEELVLSDDFSPQNMFKINREQYFLKQKGKDISSFASFSTHDNKLVEQIGTGAFIICSSQIKASEKCANLLNSNDNKPKIMMAPPIQEINWQYLGMRQYVKVIRQILFIIMYVGLFLIYMFGFNYFLSIVQNISLESVFEFFCSPSKCRFNDKTQGFGCNLCQSVSTLIITLIPTLSNVLVNSLVPIILRYMSKLLCTQTVSSELNIQYRLLFLFLIMIVGLMQIIFPPIIDEQSGQLNLNIFRQFSIQNLLNNLGKNIVDQQFYFIHYIISKYFTFPLFSLLNFKNILFYILYKMFRKNSFELIQSFKYTEFYFMREFAYMSHMFVVSLIFSISVPLVNVIAFVVFCGMNTIQRYQLLYTCAPSVVADFGSQQRILLMMISDLFVGIVFMFVSLGSYFLLQALNAVNQVNFIESLLEEAIANGEIIYYIGFGVCIVTITCLSIWKKNIDQSYARATKQLAAGDYEDANELFVNPEHIRDNYNPKEYYHSVFDLNKASDVRFLQEKKILKDGKYKEKCADRWLRKIHCDLTKLPLSYINFLPTSLRQSDDQAENQARRCRILSERCLRETPLNDKEVDECRAAYTHPAIVAAIHDMIRQDPAFAISVSQNQFGPHDLLPSAGNSSELAHSTFLNFNNRQINKKPIKDANSSPEPAASIAESSRVFVSSKAQ